MTATVTVKQVGHSAVEQVVDQVEAGLGDGTTYYYFGLGASEHISLQCEDTPGTAGNNTYTWEETNDYDGDLASRDWNDKTNDRFGVANWTTDAQLDCQDVIKAAVGRVKMVRAADGSNEDGATHLWMRRGA